MRVRDGTEETKRPTDFIHDRVRARTNRLTGTIVTLSGGSALGSSDPRVEVLRPSGV